MTQQQLILIYAVPLLLLWLSWIAVNRFRSHRNRAILEDNRQAGLLEPNTLHPVIDPARCLGCAACVRACPEKTVLGIIDGKAALIEPTMCVGHGACRTACPTDAINLVFGTETRGVDIPLLSPEFETSVPGIYIAGELGGMGLIKNAIEQGRQAIGHAAQRAAKIRTNEPGVLDVVIVGCGPAGIAASLGALERKLRSVTLDQATLGGTVAHFPRGKVVMTAPATLPMIGKVKFGEISKESLLSFWEETLTKTGLRPQFEEQVMSVRHRTDQLHEVATNRQVYLAKTVILAIGRRGTPRTLGVPGEDRPNVVYRLIDPEQYAGKSVLVVGGGDSALEAAARLAEQPRTRVTLSYRSNSFSRARAKNRDSLAAAVEAGKVTSMLGSVVREIKDAEAVIEIAGSMQTVPADIVIVCAGGVLPTQFLHDMGIDVETKYGVV